jgi:hypothetical protein
MGTKQWKNGSAIDEKYYNPEDVKRYNEETARHLENSDLKIGHRS